METKEELINGTNGTENGTPATNPGKQEPSGFSKFVTGVYGGFVRFKNGKVTRWIYRGGQAAILGLGLKKWGDHCYKKGVASVTPTVVTIAPIEEEPSTEEPESETEKVDDVQGEEET